MLTLQTRNGQAVVIDPAKKLAEGREAAIYKINSQEVAKVYLQPTHPSIAANPVEIKAAKLRLQELEAKLQKYPVGMPKFFVNPIERLYNNKQLVGYTMPYIQNGTQYIHYLTKSFVDKGVSWRQRQQLFKDLYAGVLSAHQLNVVLGDGMSPRNFEVDSAGKVWGVDTLAYQYDKFYCMMLTDRVVDPRLLKPGVLDLESPYDIQNDWYGLYVLSFEALVFYNPYSSMLTPANRKALGIQENQRRQYRITVFHDKIVTPKGLPHWSIIPDDLLQEYYTTFTTDTRKPYPIHIWDQLRPTTCKTCGTEHYRTVCPSCTQVAAPSVKQKTQISTSIRADMLFKVQSPIYVEYMQSVSGLDLQICVYNPQEKALTYLYSTPSNHKIQQKLAADYKKYVVTGLYENKPIAIFDSNLQLESVEGQADIYLQKPQAVVTPNNIYSVEGGVVYNYHRKQKFLIKTPMGIKTANNTAIWANHEYGLGFSGVEGLYTMFMWDKHHVLDDIATITGDTLFTWPGPLIAANVYIANHLAWLGIRYQSNTGEQLMLYLIDLHKKQVIDVFSNQSWITTIEGNAAIGDVLLTPTDDGVISYKHSTKETIVYDATEPYVNNNSRLFFSPTGIFAFTNNQLWHLTLK